MLQNMRFSSTKFKGIISVILVAISIVWIGSICFAQPKDDAYVDLCDVMDRYHRTFDVYTDLSAAGNHFMILEKMGKDVEIKPGSKESPHSGADCIENKFYGTDTSWGGWYFMNGVLEGEESWAKANWGDYPNAGFNLTGAKKLTFWARGKDGGEKVEFFAFGVGRNGYTGESNTTYPDSSPKVTICGKLVTPCYITLTKEWQQYTIDLTGLDLSYVLGGFGWITNAQQNNNKSITFYLDDIRYDKSRLDEPRFLISYELLPTDKPVLKNTAYTYDNALALLAFLEYGDLMRARLIADAICYAIEHDRYFSDGRLRNAYEGGDLKLFPGWRPHGKESTVRIPGWWDTEENKWNEDEHCVSTYTGNVAWAMIALLSFYEKTGEKKYLNSAITLGEWIEKNGRDDRGAGGYTGGYKGGEETANNPLGQTKILWKSTEHNIDVYVAFERLYRLTGNEKWKERALHAKKFVESMWDEKEGHFWTGTLDDGITINKSTIPLDIQAWAIMAFGDKYKRAIEWAEKNCYVEDNDFKGFDFNNNRDGIWFEGTGHMTIAYQIIGEKTKADTYLKELEKAQKEAQNANGKGLVAASHDGVSTGFDWVYIARLHIGATSWFLFAELGYNPYWNTKINNPVATSLTIIKQGAGNGTVTSDDGGISCGSDCTESYPLGTTVTLTAIPDENSTFAGWSGGCNGPNSTCTVVMNSDVNVTAVFSSPNQNQYPLITSYKGLPSEGPVPLTVTFTCDAYDPDGSIAEYRWDFDGDGNIDKVSSNNTVSYTYEEIGTYNAKVIVVDNEGANSFNQIPITVYECTPDGDVAPLGNRDGVVNVGDALVALRFALGLETPTPEDICHGDVAPLKDGKPNPDGSITVGDALVILRKAVGLVDF